MVTDYLHGIEVIEINDGIRPIQTVRSAVIGLIGTAEHADPDIWPLNTPVLCAGNQQLALTLGALGQGTLPDAMDAIFAQTGAVVIVVRVTDAQANNGTFNQTISNLVGT